MSPALMYDENFVMKSSTPKGSKACFITVDLTMGDWFIFVVRVCNPETNDTLLLN